MTGTNARLRSVSTNASEYTTEIGFSNKYLGRVSCSMATKRSAQL